MLCGADVAVVVFDCRGQRFEGGFLSDSRAARAGGASANPCCARPPFASVVLAQQLRRAGGLRRRGVRRRRSGAARQHGICAAPLGGRRAPFSEEAPLKALTARVKHNHRHVSAAQHAQLHRLLQQPSLALRKRGLVADIWAKSISDNGAA